MKSWETGEPAPARRIGLAAGAALAAAAFSAVAGDGPPSTTPPVPAPGVTPTTTAAAPSSSAPVALCRLAPDVMPVRAMPKAEPPARSPVLIVSVVGCLILLVGAGVWSKRRLRRR